MSSGVRYVNLALLVINLYTPIARCTQIVILLNVTVSGNPTGKVTPGVNRLDFLHQFLSASS